MGDASLWKLLAEVNDLPTATDEKGNPIASLKRGNELRLPSYEQVQEYRKRTAGQKNTFGFRRQIVAMPGTTLETKARESSNPEGQIIAKVVIPKHRREAVNNASITLLSPQVRVNRKGVADDNSLPYAAVLEMRIDDSDKWLPVLSYEFGVEQSWRHEMRADGGRSSRRIYLPPRAAKELSENDILNNWESYVAHFGSKETAAQRAREQESAGAERVEAGVQE